ncbi:MAG: peptidase S10 [Saprospiraceae bacterium]|nr:peptidase S10 [Saprospiraceae bacterium]
MYQISPLPILLILLTPISLSSQSEGKSSDTIKPVPEPKTFLTNHTGIFGAGEISYDAIASEIPLTTETGDTTAMIWSVAYVRSDSGKNRIRPVTFVFNGGPGSASVWLHMGLLGPKLVKVPGNAEADDGSPPYPIVNNVHGLLDITDLVFVDPVGTGYSCVVGKGKVEDFWGLMEDAKSIAQFIRSWITVHQRWNHPKYIAGESFGTTRAAAVAHQLMSGGQDVALNGLVMISQALDYAGSTSDHYNITSYLTYLPSMAATAWYHKKAGQDLSLSEFAQKAREFTYDIYGPALLKGSLLNSSDRQNIVDQLSYFTGLDPHYIDQSNLRILVPRFQKELMRDEGITIGRLDGRYKAREADLVSERPTIGDPASYSISSAYTAALNQYFADDLKIKMDRPYLTSNSKIYTKWNWKPVAKTSGWEPSYVNTAPLLGEAMRKNSDLRVLILSGYYDLITPFFDAEYTFARNGIVQDRLIFKYYEGGHMMYTHADDLPRVCQDMRAFLTEKD